MSSADINLLDDDPLHDPDPLRLMAMSDVLRVTGRPCWLLTKMEKRGQFPRRVAGIRRPHYFASQVRDYMQNELNMRQLKGGSWPWSRASSATPTELDIDDVQPQQMDATDCSSGDPLRGNDPLRVMNYGDLSRVMDVSPDEFAAMDKRNELPMPMTLTPRGTKLWLASDVHSWLAGKPVDRIAPAPRTPGCAAHVAGAAGREDDDARDAQRYAPRRRWRSVEDFEAEPREPRDLKRVLRVWVEARSADATKVLIEKTEQL
ncbi:hypothetical protein [Paraburkholderia phenoliruptrix]|uniref:hypothetical protein n=1 Tax=Paraburkholderia phenoliruptrix TaxID=252970 RepID=UPI001C4EAE46|nr:hypothetical protein [Paraburkholderia phenoliruptrix]MBW0449240.1 hypothetical protein [Paraburkholderia phenoliruptrix]MBW9097520.1 hypothetical protein [Paraburkholderia phenoliruptrix]